MGEENGFDAELNAIMGGGEAPIQEAPQKDTPPKQNSVPSEQMYEAAGRKWKGQDLAKAHDSLAREFGSRNKDWAELKELRSVREQINKDPEFARYFRGAIEAYQKMRDAGQSQTTAQAKAGLPPEVAQKLEKVDRFETLADQIELEREESALMRKYKIDDATLKKVEDYSVANGGIPLEQSYKQMMFDLHQEQLAGRREAEAARKKEVSKTSGPVHEAIQPSDRRVSLKSDADWRQAAGKELGKYFKDSE